MDQFPMKLSQTTLANWGSYVVPVGKHKNKTFAEVAKESGSNYRGRECTSIWAKSLCAYAYEMEMVSLGKKPLDTAYDDQHGGDDLNTEHDNDDGKDDDTHGGGYDVNTQHDKDHDIDYDNHGDGYGVNTDHGKDDSMDCDKHGGGYDVDGQDKDKGLRTIILKVPHDAKVTVQMP